MGIKINGADVPQVKAPGETGNVFLDQLTDPESKKAVMSGILTGKHDLQEIQQQVLSAKGKLEGTPAKAKTTVSIVNNVTKEEKVIKETEEEVYVLPTNLLEMFHLNVSGKLVKNLGNYNAAHFMVSLTGPTTLAHLDKAYDFLHQFVEDKIIKEVGELGKKNGEAL